MPNREDIVYFGAGPALLPTEVLQSASAALVNYQDTGLGLAEHSHRSELASSIVREARADLAAFLDVPTSDYEVVILQAGGTGEFAATVYNLVGAWVQREAAALLQSKGLPADTDIAASRELLAVFREKVQKELRLDYVVTGSWSLKAYQEAQRLLGPEYVNLVADGRKVDGSNGAFGAIPDESTWSLSPNPALVYFCDNETVHGVEFPRFPAILEDKKYASVVVADMSSNILSRPVKAANYGVFFFGAQKNLGSTGITVAVVKKSLLPQASPALLRGVGLPVGPIVFSYETLAKNDSLYNTLSIFDCYIAGQVLKKLLATYPDKAAGQEKVSEQKAKLIYAALEAHPDVYNVFPAKAARSRMNIVFGVKATDGDKAFLKEATAHGLTGLKGHRSVPNSIRASNYNSITLAGAQKLAEFIDAYAKQTKA